jgi:hypothetical protein
MVQRMASRTESELAWAEKTARELLAPLEARWRHTLRVVEQGESFRDVLDGDELEVLLAASYLPKALGGRLNQEGELAPEDLRHLARSVANVLPPA